MAKPALSDDLVAQWSDRWWRLENLYWVQDEYGSVRKFKMRPAQTLRRYRPCRLYPVQCLPRLWHAPAPMIRHGRTAGQIWNAHGFPHLHSIAWFGNRLTEMGCGIYGRGELGDNRARLFDPDKASDWIKSGGKAMVEGYVKERAGQGKLEGM